MKDRRIILASVFTIFSALASAQSSIQIEIKSSWWGRGSAPDSQLLVAGSNGQFSASSKRVDPVKVQELLDAINADQIAEPSLRECGADQAWLETNYAQALEGLTHRKLQNLSKEQIKLFRSGFTGEQSSESAFESLVNGWHTDDFPKLSVDIREGGREFGVSSGSQSPFMLPWAGLDEPRGGYSCRISRAIYALLPKKFTNRERLSLGVGFRRDLAGQIMHEIGPDWNRLDAQRLVGSEIAPIVERFTLLSSEVSNLSSIDLDGLEAWNARLRSKDLPPNLIIGVSLSRKKGKLPAVDAFVSRSPEYAELVLSVPWLHAYLNDKPNSKIELRFVNDRSLSWKAERDLAQDLRSHGKPELAERVDRDAAESAFIEVNSHDSCWARALVFPDRTVLLWHFQCDQALGFHASQFSTWDFYGWHSVGAMIEPDGSLHH
jgi:hypothetical protein